MDKNSRVDTVEDETHPILRQLIPSPQLAGFDSIVGTEASQLQKMIDESLPSSHQQKLSVLMPSSPLEAASNDVKTVLFQNGNGFPDSFVNSAADEPEVKHVTFHSEPMPEVSDFGTPASTANLNYHPRMRKRYYAFRTRSGKSFSENLRDHGMEDDSIEDAEWDEVFPVYRYYDALEGPELDTLRTSEENMLPDDKTWPFLLRFPITSFGICLGVSSQALMWKTLATATSTKFLHIGFEIHLILWTISIAIVAIVSSIYLLKVIVFFEAVRREYYHPVRVNFFFAPWISLLFLALDLPPSIATDIPHAIWYVVMLPILILELKIYGQWMLGGQRRLSEVANASNHLSVVGNFVGAMLGASMGLKEGPIFFFAVGLAHYIVVFVTLYQRLPTNETLPKDLHPVFFLFVAAPSFASIAWAKIQGYFDYGSRITYFVSLFLYFSLAVRVNLFRGFKFSLAWWAYTFPMTGAAIATIEYSSEVTNMVTQALSCIISVVATLTVSSLLVKTILKAFVSRDLFPNDIAITVSETRPRRPATFSAQNMETFDSE